LEEGKKEKETITILAHHVTINTETNAKLETTYLTKCYNRI
jgi:hypothetical protein